jgi:predicted metal-dependent phosphoesterase TrpH
MKLDLHVHIRRHHRIEDLRRVVKARGLDGIAVTNFHNVTLAQYLHERIEDFLVIVGQEVESKRGHILAVNIAEKIPDDLEPEETIRRIHAQGGIAILAHPYLVWNSILPHGRTRDLPFDAIECFNYRCSPLLWPNFLAKFGLRHLPWPRVANTDSKDMATIGLCHNDVPVTPAERYSTRLAEQMIPEILHCIRKGQIRRCEQWQMPSWDWFSSNLAHIFLPHRYYSCLHCGDKIVFHFARRTRTCLSCGRQEAHNVCCVRGHFVCSVCRTKKALETPEFATYRKKLDRAMDVNEP